MDAAGPEQTRYEPLPRWGHVSVVIENKLYLWGGRIEDFSEESKKEVSLHFMAAHCDSVLNSDFVSTQVHS